MTAKLIDAKARTRRSRESFRSEITSFIASTGVTPTLAVVLIGNDAPDTQSLILRLRGD
jgi:5,10-methylene-tetrahydrofolate dehydrogenase/methenyl tetrahydrofolate cyclohydrolase